MNQYIFARQEKLILDLVSPVAGQSLLDVGCGTGNYLSMFQKSRCTLTGIDPSDAALASARKKLGHPCELVRGNITELPFSDNEFDIVCAVFGPQTSDDPQKVLAEAVRVSRGRVFVGFFSKYSLVGTQHSVRKLFGFPLTTNMRFFTVREMQALINKTMAVPSVTWGSVMYLPKAVYAFFSELEDFFPMKNNPLGAFVGMVFPVRYTYRTVQNPILNSFDLKAKTRATAPEAIRGMLQQRDP